MKKFSYKKLVWNKSTNWVLIPTIMMNIESNGVWFRICWLKLRFNFSWDESTDNNI